MKKNKTLKFFISLAIILVVLTGIFVGGYFILDKAVVPKYFGEYGIHNMSELVGMMSTLYNNKTEKDIVINPFTSSDADAAESKLIAVGFPALSSGRLDYKKLAEGDYSPDTLSEVSLTDRELASLIDGMLQSGVLVDKLPNLKYINTLYMSCLQVKIYPEYVDGVINENKADLSFIIKLDTSSMRGQMAEEMQMPIFLLNMIVPNTMYITSNITLEVRDGEWVYEGGGIGINGKTEKQSKILLNLLIDFIFPKEDNMTIEELESSLGDVVIKGTSLLGSARFTDSIYSSMQTGIVVTFV